MEFETFRNKLFWYYGFEIKYTNQVYVGINHDVVVSLEMNYKAYYEVK